MTFPFKSASRRGDSVLSHTWFVSSGAVPSTGNSGVRDTFVDGDDDMDALWVCPEVGDSTKPHEDKVIAIANKSPGNVSL